MVLAALLLCLPADKLVSDGVERTYEVYAPKSAPPRAPALVVLHGLASSGHEFRGVSGFDAEADAHGFVAVYPDGVGQRWLDARQLTLPPEKRFPGADDARFILKLIDTLAAKGLVDPARVYVAGNSNGAMMTLTLACAHADRFVGIGVVSGALPKVPCAPARALAAIFFQGTDDPLIPFKGGGVGPNGERGFVESADDTVKVFADKAGCKPGKKRMPNLGKAMGDGTALVVEERAECAVPVARVIIDKGGHGWPGRPHGSDKIDATHAIAAFFFEAKLP